MGKSKMGLWMLLALVIGNMIGSGVYMLPASLAQIGSITIYSWILTAIGAICVAFVFGRLSEALPKTGGPYAYAEEGFGRYIGSQSAFLYWIYVWTGNAAIAIAGTGYLSFFIPSLKNPLNGAIAAIIILWILTFNNMRNARDIGFFQILITIIKLLPLIAVILCGWFFFHPHYITESVNVTGKSNLSAISLGLNFTLWAFVGIESATVPAGSVDNPKRNIPLATIIGTLFVAAFYIVVSVVVMGMIPNGTLQTSSAPFADAAQIIFGHFGGTLIALGAFISCVGCINGFIMLQGQVPMAASKEGLFPFSKFFSKTNKNDMPVNALVFSTILTSFFLLFTVSGNLNAQFNLIINLATSFAILVYFLSALSEVILAKRNGLKIRLRAKLTIVIAIAYTFWAFFSVGPEMIFYEMILIFVSMILYVFCDAAKKKDPNLSV